jgi:hypothetical protein
MKTTTLAAAAVIAAATPSFAESVPSQIDGEQLAPSTRHYLALADHYWPHHRQSGGIVAQVPQYSGGNGGVPPEYRIATPFERVKNLCEADADATHRSAFVNTEGDPYAGAAYLGWTIANIAGHARAYEQCMTAHGLIRQQ